MNELTTPVTATSANPDESIASRIALYVHRHYSKHFSGVDLDDEKDSVLINSVHVEMLTEGIDQLLKLAHTSPDPDGWIATSERLPEEIGDYLIIGSIPNTTGRFMDAATFVDGAFQTHMDGEITHWWPIPKWPTPPVREQP